MTLRMIAILEWRCQACGDQCHRMNREIDNFDLQCDGCGQCYVIVAPDYAVPAGA